MAILQKKIATLVLMKMSIGKFLCLVVVLALCSCGSNRSEEGTIPCDEKAFVNPLMEQGSSPCLVCDNGMYYYTQATYMHVSIWSAASIAELRNAEEHVVYEPGDCYYVSGPCLYKFNGNWYMYYISEGGEYSMKAIHVLENTSASPLEGEFVEKSIIKTGNPKSVHPSVFNCNGQLYLLWSGYGTFSEGGIMTRSIYIAKMSNPWTVSSSPKRVLSPSFEWECQWVSYDGPSSQNPSYVNEAPQLIFSKDSTRVLMYFAASEPCTSYYCEGMAYSRSDSDLTSADSWSKLPEPVFSQNADSLALGAGHLTFFRDRKDSLYILYNAYSGRMPDNTDNRSTRMQRVSWSKDGIPQLGKPVACSTCIPEPAI